jgi:hypothetical protein
MDTKIVLTKEKTAALVERIQKGLEENKISGSAQMIAYVVREAWCAGFEEGRKQPERTL